MCVAIETKCFLDREIQLFRGVNLRGLGQSDRSSLCFESAIKIRVFLGGRQSEVPRKVDFCKCRIVNLVTDSTLYSVYR